MTTARWALLVGVLGALALACVKEVPPAGTFPEADAGVAVGAPVRGPCQKTGCSGELCAEEAMVSPCVFQPVYECYRDAICERGSDGRCSFRQTEALQACVRSHGS